MGSHILRNNNLAQEIQNGSGLSGSGNVVSVWLSRRAEASRGLGFSPAVKSQTPAYFYCFYRKQKDNSEPKIFPAVSPPTNDVYLESLNAVKLQLMQFNRVNNKECLCCLAG